MYENTVLDPYSVDDGTDVVVDDATATEVTAGEETGATGEDATASTATGGDTYVNVVSGGDDVVSRVVTLDPYIIEEGDNSLLALVNRVFGEYQPRTQTVTETMTDGTVVTYSEPIGGLSGLDFYWLGGVLVFSIVLISFFKFLGGIFRGR